MPHKASFDRLYGIIKRLRAPGGCPWDREQTPASMRGSLIEEAYELVEAINEGDSAHVLEEAGDLYLLVTMISAMYEEEGAFTVSQVLENNADKLVRRHPHVFGESSASSTDEVLEQWNTIKETVEGRRKKDSLLDEVSRALPPLERAYKIQKKAAKAGFDWDRAEDVWAKAREELEESKEAAEAALASGDRDALEEELGDLLFSVVNVARYLSVDPAVALHRTIEKFSSRFRHVERRMAESGSPMQPGKLAQMDAFWDEAKGLEAGAKEK